MSDDLHIILIEDDAAQRTGYTRALSKGNQDFPGYRVEAFAEAEPAMEHLRNNPNVILVITDLNLPRMDGVAVLREVKSINPEVVVLMVTGHATVESAVEAMKLGAGDYLIKPVDLHELRAKVKTHVENVRLTRRVLYLETLLEEKFRQLKGHSKVMEALRRQMDLVAPTRSNVLIIGESGTGKELVANALHENSPRKDARFLAINCAAIPAEILESELFGHERGSFTGATGRKLGKFELADKGTLFLDEIGELPLEMQVKLLRVLEQREFMRVGGSESIKVDIRLIAATNQDLEALVEQSRFRGDLYYRLKVVTLRIPPLRERAEDDIPLLANHFLQQLARENSRDGMRFSAEAMKALVAARWEGNVRELRNVVESLVVLAPALEITLQDLPEEYRGQSIPPERRSSPFLEGPASAPDSKLESGRTMEEIEKQAILRALEQTEGNRTRAAEILGIGLRTLQRKLKEYKESEQAEERR